MRKLLWLLLLIPTLASAQDVSVRYQSQAISNRGLPLANQNVAICTQPAVTSTQPCSPLATLGTNTSTSSGGANPTTTDSNGNFFFYAAPGKYTVQIYGPQVQTPFIQPDVNVNGGIFSGSITVPLGQTATFLGLLQCRTFESVLCVDSANTQGWTGSDVGAWLNSAYATLPSTGGEIDLYNLGTTCMAFSTPVVWTTAGKYVKFVGRGASKSDTTAGPCLNYTPITGTVAFTLDYVPAGKTIYPSGHGWDNIILENNGGCTTTGGCGGTSAFGIQVGNTNQGIQGATMKDVTLNGFADAFVNQTFNSVDVTWINPDFVSNNEGYFFTNVNSQTIYGGQFTANGIAIKAGAGGGGEMILHGVNLLANSVGTIVLSGATTPVQLNITDSHFESNTTLLFTTHFITGNFNLTMKGGLMEDDVPSGVCTTNCDYYISSSGNYMNIYGTMFSAPFRVPTQVILLNSPVRAYIHAVNNAPAVLTTFIGGANTAFATLKVDNAGTGNTATLTQWEGPFKCGFGGFGDATFVPAAGVCQQIKFNANNFDALDFNETTFGAGDWRVSPGTGGIAGFVFRNQTNAKQQLQMLLASPFPVELPQGVLDISEVAAPSGLASNDRCYGDSTAHALKCSYNNGTFFQIPQVITATSAAFAAATTAGTCVQNTTAVTGAATTMAVSVSPVSTPGIGAVWSAFVSSAGNVTINECAVATSAGGSIAFNIRVTP